MKKDAVRMGTKIGAVIGGIGFLVFGILPGFYFGSYAALVLMSKLMGGPLQPTLIVRVLTVAGIALGMVCIASAFIVLGAVFGTMVGYLTVSAGKAKEEEKSEGR